jgi:hypothetical protein
MKAVLASALLGIALAIAALQARADSFANPALKPSTPPLQNARVDGLDIDRGKLSITDCGQLRSAPEGRPLCEGSAFNLSVNDEALRTKLKAIHLGDHIRVNFAPEKPAPGTTASAAPPALVVSEIAGLAAPKVSTIHRLGVLLAAFASTFLLGALLTGGRPLKLILGMDNRYSNSKLQAALWFWVFITSYLEFLYFRIAVGGLDFLGAISIPQNLLLLSGMSAITFAGAKGITTAKANAAADATAAQAQQDAAQDNPPGISSVAVADAPGSVAVATTAPTPIIATPRGKSMADPGTASLWKDLMQNDLGHFDFGDFQMVIVTMLAVGTYLLAVHHALGAVPLSASATLPDLDTTILSAFGLGQGAYLAKKAVGNASAT